MRVRVRQICSVILTFALILGCFAGTELTARAGIFEISISSEELESKGGKVTVTVAGEELGDTVWWVLEKENPAQEEGEETAEEQEKIYETVGEKMNTADVDDTHMMSEFSIDIPENMGNEDVVYRIRAAKTDPYHPETDEYVWEGEEVKVTVAAKNDKTLEEDGEKVEAKKTDETGTGDLENESAEEQKEVDEKLSEDIETIELPSVDVSGTESQEVVPHAVTIPKYHKIPPYQQKNVFSTTTVRVKEIPINELLDGKETPINRSIKFRIYNCTKQITEQYVDSKNGKIPAMNLVNDHNYIIFAEDQEYKLNKSVYIWVKDGKLLDIKDTKGAQTYVYPELKSIRLVKRAEGEEQGDDDRVLMHLPVYYKNNTYPLLNVKVKFVSAVETIETSTGFNGYFGSRRETADGQTVVE